MDQPPNYDAPKGLAGPDRGGVSPRLVIAIVGALIAIALGAAVAFGLFRADPGDDTPPAAAEGGLKIEVGTAQGGDRLDPARPLRCFVGDKMVGELTVAQCAQRNGVATQNLDVGLNAEGDLVAAVTLPERAPDPVFPEPEPQPQPEPIADDYTAPTAPDSGPAGECMRHAGGDWRAVGESLPLDTCVQLLFTGRCEPPGSAAYGRWNGQTVRLVTGRVEIAADGANFRTLAEQDASCMLP